MPQNVQNEFIGLLKDQAVPSFSKLLSKIEKGLKDVKKVREGKGKTYTLSEILNEN